MTDNRVGQPRGRMKEADATRSAAKRLENEGRADRARGANNAVDKVADTLSGREPAKRWGAHLCESTQLGAGR